jgi:hypothetical protein
VIAVGTRNRWGVDTGPSIGNSFCTVEGDHSRSTRPSRVQEQHHGVIKQWSRAFPG